MLEKCWIVLRKVKPKTVTGWLETETGVGWHGRGRKKQGFILTEGYLGFVRDARRDGKRPFLLLEGDLALPVGYNIVSDAVKIHELLKIITESKYVKSLTLRIFDTVETLIIMAAGAGVFYFLLKLIAIFTKSPVTI